MTTINLEFCICSANLNEEGPPEAKVHFLVFPRLSCLLSKFSSWNTIGNVLQSNLLISESQQVSHTSLDRSGGESQCKERLEDRSDIG